MARLHINIVRERFGNRPFRVREAVDVGIPRQALYRLRDDGSLVRASRGVWQRADADPSMHSEFAAVAARVPGGTVCLNSGLSFWDLSDELPSSVHLAVARGAHWPKIDTPTTTLHRFNAETFRLERQAERTETGEPFWIYSAARCVVDAMRMQRQVGRDVALAALRRYMASDDADPLLLSALARQLGGERHMRQALEVILA